MDNIENVALRTAFTSLRLELYSSVNCHNRSVCLCDHCQEPRSSSHLLLHCKKYLNERNNMLKHIANANPEFSSYNDNVKLYHLLNPINMNSLLYDKCELRNTVFSFISFIVKER